MSIKLNHSARISRFVFTCILLLAVIGLQPVRSVHAATAWYVATTGSDVNSCSTPASPCATMNGAIQRAAIGDTIYVAAGAYTGSGNEVVYIDRGVTLSGGWDAAFTKRTGFSIIDGEGLRRGIRAFFSQTGTLEWFLITNGSSDEGGGGIENRGDVLILNNVSINNNRAVQGGAIINSESMVLNNVTVSENTAIVRGGGIYTNYNAPLSLNNVTISNNKATQFNSYGGGLYADGQFNINIQNTIISGNSAAYGPDCFRLSVPIVSGGHNLIGDTTSCPITAASGDQFNVNPQLGTFLPVQGYHPLLATSPAIDAGNAATCQADDQRGLPRVGTCDIGAYEYHAPGSAVQLSPVKGDHQIVSPGATFRQPLQVVALDAQGDPISGVDVTFTAPYTGVLIFTNSQTYELSVTTDESGIASSGEMVAGAGYDPYVVTASTPGIPPVEFHLENTFWYVRPDGNNANECKLFGSACATIDGALAKAQPGNTIRVASGTYTGTGSGNGTQTVLINKDIVIEGGWDAYFSNQSGRTVIDGQNARRGITLRDGYKATLTNFTIIHGNDYEDGGGIFNAGTLVLRNSTISNNSASLTGGAIQSAGNLTLENVGIFDNTARDGGGISVYYGTATLKNVTISGNAATYTGGLLVTGGNGVALNNVTISNNTSEYYSAGIDQSYSDPISIENSIVAGNSSTNSTADDCAGDIVSNGHNLIQNVTGCSVTPKDGDQFNVDPQLDAFDLAAGVQPLLPNSPAIDAGNDATCEGVDQRGVNRPQGGHCDMGAYEYDPVINYVKWDAEGKNNGASWTDAFTDLQSALAAASSGDQIWVAAGTYKPSTGTGRSGTFALENGVAIYGGFAGTETSLSERNFEANVTILSGEIGTEGDNTDNSFHVVTARDNDSTAMLDGFTITGGNANGNYPNDIGGGMLSDGGSPSLSNLIFSQNSAGGGGGMFSRVGSPSLLNVLFIGNTSTNGGGGMGTTNSNAYLSQVTFTGNSSTNGGGMRNDNSSPRLEKVTFINNTASGGGGGMSNAAASPLLVDVIFETNTAGYGGGMSSNGNANPDLRNVTFKGNTANAYGGGMDNVYSSPTLTNVTFTANSASAGGGAISNEPGSPILNHVTIANNTSNTGAAIYNGGNYTRPVITNSILWGNTGTNGLIVNEAGGDITISYSIVQGGYSGTGNLNSDPKLAPLDNNGGFTETMALLPGSPAINTGSAASCAAVDQRGVGRPQGVYCDRGAFEFVPSTSVILTVTKTADTNDGICNADCSLREALVNSYNGDTIQFAVNGTIVLTSDLPVINKSLVVDGRGKTVKLDGNNLYRIFKINETGGLTLKNMTLQNGHSNVPCNADIDTTCGSAIYNNGGLSAFNVTFSHNTADLGGAIFIEFGTTKIQSSTFTANSAARQGGGILNWIGTELDVVNSTFYGNYAVWDGGAIYNDISDLTLINNTFSSNSAERGGAVYNSAGNLAMFNNILANSTSGDDCFNESPYAAISLNINNLIERNAASPNNCGSPSLTADPRLGPLANNGGVTQTMALLKDSPAIDAASDAYCPAADQRDVARPYGAYCDIGAYEQNGSILPVTPTFADVPLSNPYWQDIETLYVYGLTGGCQTSPLKFCPDQIMNRGQAAVFMLRGNFGSSYVPPVPTHIFQDDWSKGTWAEPWAEGMKAEGLSAGCLVNPLKYCPWDQIPREQAVIFALRMKYGKDYTPPPATGTVFADMTNPGYYATAWAEKAYKDGIIPNCGMSGNKPLFCPKNVVSRGLAAYMIVRAKSLTMP